MKAGIEARQRIRDGKKKEQELQDTKLNRLIEVTAQANPLHAMNLDKLLKKQWNEESNSFILLSKLNPRKWQKKINELCFNRYVL